MTSVFSSWLSGDIAVQMANDFVKIRSLDCPTERIVKRTLRQYQAKNLEDFAPSAP